MRHFRSSSSELGPARLTCASDRNPRQGNAMHISRRRLSHFGSPTRMKHQSSGPSMTAERFLLLVADLQARANELWAREQQELQRGAELMVICVTPSPQCPHNHTTAPEQMDATYSPPELEHVALLQPHANILNSPSSLLTSGAHQLTSPCWSNDFHTIAASLGLAPHVTNSSEYATGSGSGGGFHGTGSGQAVSRGSRVPQHNGSNSASIWQPLGMGYDGEALITLQHPALGGGSGGGGSGARTAKARLVDRFDGIMAAGGTATARQAHHSTDSFGGLMLCSPDDIFASPSWARTCL